MPAAKPVSFRVVIPSRMASSRLVGKPLKLIAGRSMISRVWDLAMGAGAKEVIVATDDERIVLEVEDIGGRALMTRSDHLSGTDRLAEVVTVLGWSDDTVVVNLQGDEPCIPGSLLADLAGQLCLHEEAGIATMATPIHEASELFSDSAVKVVLDEEGMALYFSRAPIPWVRGTFSPGQLTATLPEGTTFLRHIGMYAYRASVLRRLARHPAAESECAESLEQLRALAMGIKIHVRVVLEAPPAGVDTQEDLDDASRYFSENTQNEGSGCDD